MSPREPLNQQAQPSDSLGLVCHYFRTTDDLTPALITIKGPEKLSVTCLACHTVCHLRADICHPNTQSVLLRVRKHELSRSLGLSIRAAVGATLAYALASFAGLQYPIFALTAAVIVTDFSLAEASKLGTSRVVGTFVGAVSGAILPGAAEPSA